VDHSRSIPATEPTDTASDRRSTNDRRFAIFLTAIFLAIAIFNVCRHVMWRDETRAWQIAAASPALRDLYHNLRFEGVPMLWYLIVWGSTKVTSNMLAMQIVHAMMAAGVVLTFALAAPFGRWIKALFAFGYFPFFEYATISRNYGLVFLFFLIGAAILSLPKPRPLLLAIVLALLAQTSIWGAAFAGLMMFVAMAQWLTFTPRWIAAATIVLASCVLCYVEASPGPGAWFIIGWGHDMPTLDRLMASVATIYKGWLPVPLWQRWWWNSNVLDGFVPAECLLAILMLLIAVICLRRSRAALLLLLLGVIGQVAFTYHGFRGFTRHHGQLFMVLIVALWLAKRFGGVTKPGWIAQRRDLLLAVLLSIHAIVGIGATIVDWIMPFSAGKATAQFISRNTPPDLTLAGVDDYCMSPISAYLGREFYFPQIHDFAPFNTQDDRIRDPITPDLLNDIRTLLVRKDRDVLLVLSGAQVIDKDRASLDFDVPASGTMPAMRFRATLLRQLLDSTVPDETYSLYRCTPAE
jgi:hypothetical protein